MRDVVDWWEALFGRKCRLFIQGSKSISHPPDSPLQITHLITIQLSHATGDAATLRPSFQLFLPHSPSTLVNVSSPRIIQRQTPLQLFTYPSTCNHIPWTMPIHRGIWYKSAKGSLLGSSHLWYSNELATLLAASSPYISFMNANVPSIPADTPEVV